MTYDFILFGGTGLQGSICARDLLESGYSVLLIGRDPRGLEGLLKNKRAGFKSVDLMQQSATVQAISDSGARVVINCAELIFNIPIMKACLKTRRSYTDLGGLQQVTKEQFKLDGAFKKNKLLALTGCGSTPGIVNVMTAYAVGKMNTVQTIRLGFAWDSNMKRFVVPYSIQSIFDEFTQDPIVLRNGKFITEKRLTCYGTYEFQEVGPQTVYCIVHSEVYTFAKYFKKKGIKNIHYMAGFPEHSLKVIQALMAVRFNSSKEVNINRCKVAPLDFATRVLKQLPVPSGYREVENLWTKIHGTRDGAAIDTELTCIVKTIKGWEKAGSNVDTGRTISIMSQMLERGLITQKGVHAPEAVIPQKAFFQELAHRKMYIFEDGTQIN